VAGYTDIAYMEAGASTTEYFTWAASAGTHSISIILDSANQIVEIDETNNTRIINIPLPDLTVEDITFSPSDAQIGDTLVITANILNQGGGKTEISQVDCYIDDIKIASQELISIEAGESVAKTFDWVAEAGIHTIKITIDSINTVIEDNETNNEKENDCAIATPDLIVEGMSWTTSNQLNNNEATLTIIIKNIGTGPAEESQVHYSLDSSPADMKNIASIPTGETVAFSFITILTTGQHTATIIADYNDVITELDENNNESTISFSTIAPDLVIRTITYSPLGAGDGDTVTIIIKLENRGGAKATNLQIALSIDGTIVDYADIEEMDIAVITTIEFTWVATEGEHEITVFADADQTVFESNEQNNTKSRTLSFEKNQATANTPVNTATVSDKGFIENYWWLLLIIAGLLGVIAFIPTLRSLRKK
jgi:subtilase family serine protease